MAGICNAEQLYKEKKKTGTVLYKADFVENYLLVTFIIIKLDNNMGWITQYDYNSNLRINDKIKIKDKVELIVYDDYTAEWRKING